MMHPPTLRAASEPPVLGSGRRGVESRERHCLRDNLVESFADAAVIAVIYLVVVLASPLTGGGRRPLSRLARPEPYVWLAVIVVIATFVKTFYPRCEDQVINMAVGNTLSILMAPIRSI